MDVNRRVPSVAEPPLGLGLNFYSDPRTLTDAMIDPLIRKAVYRINESGWVWTGESCQGHPGDPHAWAGNTRPMLRLITDTARVPRLFQLLFHCSFYDDPNPAAHFKHSCVGYTVWPHSVSKRVAGFWEVLIYAEARSPSERDEGIRFFERFAEAANG